MGSWRRMGAFLGLVPDDEQRDEHFDAYQGDEYAPEYAEQPRYREWDDSDRRAARPQTGPRPQPAARQPSAYGDAVTQGALAVQLRPEARAAGESTSAGRPLTVKLTGFGEARIIGERYRDGASVILDMTDLTDADARRVVDFAAGLAFAMRGSIDKVTTRVFMLLPPDADLSAEDRRAYAGSYSSR